MATRLERLWVLLDSGSTPVTRKAAAEQIGEVQKLHPHELNNLLRKVCTFLTSKSWETRIAAGQAVEAIAKNVKRWQPGSSRQTSPSGLVVGPAETEATSKESSPTSDKDSDLLTFETFDLHQVLSYGTPLLSSTVDEFQALENDPDYQKMTQQERISFHRQQLKQRLGLTAQGKVFSTGVDQLFDDSDLLIQSTYSPSGTDSTAKKKASEVHELSALQLSGLSARERNRAKRKAKQMARRASKEMERSESEAPPTKKMKTSSVVVEQAGQTDRLLIDQVTDVDSIFDESEEWPFTWFCEEMFKNLFNPCWEIRHGAATALREVVKHHGNTAGISAYTPEDNYHSENQEWLVDAAIRMICVFALDRFADFVSDQVVTPVRATCAQTLGMVVRQMDTQYVEMVVSTLLKLAAQEQWEVRHASLMGIQHLLAARTDLSQVFLPLLSSAILRGLQDVDDDVRAVAASALLPVAQQLHLIIPHQVVELSQILWDSLLELDDLSASTTCIMDLLCTLLSHNRSLFSTHHHQQQHQQQQPHLGGASQLTPTLLTTLVPRLWPFLSHTITSVRLSCLNALLTLLHTGSMNETVVGSAEQGGVPSPVQLDWLKGPFLQSALCQVFQRFALEGDEENRTLVHKVWKSILEHSTSEEIGSAIAPLFQSMAWLWLLVVPNSAPIETNLLVPPSPGATISSSLYLGGCLGVESLSVREQAALAARVAGAKALGELTVKLSSSSPMDHQVPTTNSLCQIMLHFVNGLQQFLVRNFAMHKMVVGLVLTFWKGCGYKDQLVPPLMTALTEEGSYEDLMPFLLAMQKDCHSLIVALEKKGVNIRKDLTPSAYTTEFAANLATTAFDRLKNIPLQNQDKMEIESLCRSLLTSLGQLQEEQQHLCMRVRSCIAGALISLSSLPGKFNPIIRPLMDCIKMDSNPLMKKLASKWTSSLLDMCKEQTPCPNSKIVKNLCNFLCCDPQHTPAIVPKLDEASRPGEVWEWNNGIITLVKQQQKRLSSKTKGRPSAAMKEAMAAYAACEEQRKPLVYQRQGAESALIALAKHFGPNLFTSLPQLWTNATQPLSSMPPVPSTPDQDLSEEHISSAQSVVNSLQVVEVLSPSLHPSLSTQLFSLLPRLLSCLCSPYTAVRHMAARCFATLAQVQLHTTIQFIINEVLPFLGDADSVVHREGAIESLACLLEMVGLDALCYIVLLLMPVLGRMSDQQQVVRHMASRCFAVLVSYMPLESGVSSPPEMPPDLVERRKTDRLFLEQLLDTSKLENYSVPVSIKADLRKYQQDGINWLAFLNKYNLHGILCDDMGLGKTLQSLCIIAGDHYHRCKQYELTGHSDSLPLPSLVVCPPTLTGHWYYEVKKFCNPEDLSPLQYSGPPNSRARLQSLVPKHNLIIASYDIVRNDIDFFKSINWNYCILDEGHIIKNTKTKITKAVKQVRANHRLILSGTPIQNNVLELWSLFDFLMPGFLGTEKQFYERYGKPIIQSRDAKSSSKEQEAGALAMEALHRQVLPFLLRRMKEDVLQDLPPKIIQDYHCELSPLQVKLYEDFAKSQAKQEVDEVIEGEGAVDKPPPPPTHIFQALQYLRKLCNHPALVVNTDHPMYDKVQHYLESNSTTLTDIRHAAKLTALKQLLHDCGIGLEVGEEEITSVVGQHRALLFCQYKSMLDIIERDLFKMHMPTLTYLRLDGSIPVTSRFNIVNKFNNDPSIDVLLLTTHVGGLGLNLTGADTVIFFEHDWNPMKDLQAMDRAHRIGQKKVVNVYRLITKGTLEEKIMSLQKFKLNLANTVISQENSSLLSMNTSDLLDLFQLSDTAGEMIRGSEKAGGSGAIMGGSKESMRSILENLPELWSEDQYRSEYDLSSFMKSLASVEK